MGTCNPRKKCKIPHTCLRIQKTEGSYQRDVCPEEHRHRSYVPRLDVSEGKAEIILLPPSLLATVPSGNVERTARRSSGVAG